MINISSILKSLIIESIFIITNQQKRAIAIISGEKDGNSIYGPRYRAAGGALYLIHALITIEDKL